MKTNIIDTGISGLVVVEIEPHRDERGFFLESWSKRDFAEAGLDIEFVQDNHSRSGQGVLRGLHYQDMTAPIGKLVRCTLGAIWDVGVDLRVSSPTFGQWVGVELTAENQKQFYLPVGFAHGFVTLTEHAEVQYKQTDYYAPSAEGCVIWNDPDLAIEWPVKSPVLSGRDQRGMSLKQYLEHPAFE
jgi:dTDP-4-dehydrorhamnose 3,5-epimerase